MTIKDLIKQILISVPETRNSRMLLNWEVLRSKGFIYKDPFGNEYLSISKEDFMKNNSESVRRCSQQLQREDLLLGKKLIQPSKLIKDKRIKLSQEKGASYIMGKDEVKEEWVFNPETGEYRHEM